MDEVYKNKQIAAREIVDGLTSAGPVSEEIQRR